MGKGGGKEGSKGKAKSKGKNSMYPPNSHWKDFNPDPSVIQNPQRIRWHPANKPQLKSLAADESCWNTPGNFFSDRQAGIAKASGKPVATQNKLQALQADDAKTNC